MLFNLVKFVRKVNSCTPLLQCFPTACDLHHSFIISISFKKMFSCVCVCVSRMRASANVYATEDNFWESILLPCGSPGVNCHQVWSQMPSPSEPSHCHYLLSSSWAVNPRVKLPSYCTLKSAHRHSLQLTARGPGTPTVLSNGLP